MLSRNISRKFSDFKMTTASLPFVLMHQTLWFTACLSPFILPSAKKSPGLTILEVQLNRQI